MNMENQSSAPAARIQRLCFDLMLADPAQARPMQDRISAFCRLHLNDALAQGLRGWPSGAQPLVLPRLELDLGQLAPDAPERGLERRIADALAQALARLAPLGLAEEWPGAAQLAAFFAANPAWMREEGDQLMRSALAAAPTALAQALRQAGGKELARRRLARGLSRPVIELLVRLLERGDSAVVIAYADDMLALQAQRALLPEPRDEFEAVLWEFVLAYLLLDRGSYFNTRSFVGATLQRLAQRYGIAYPALLERLTLTVAGMRLPSAARYSLPGVLAELREEAGQAGAAGPQQALADQDLLNLDAFLARGILPANAARQASAAQAVAELLERRPEQLCALIRKAGVHEAARRRLLDAAPEPVLVRLVRLLEPADGEQIAEHVGQLRRLQAQHRVVPQEGAAYARSLWLFVLTYLLVERGSWFNTRSFVRSLLQQMAAQYRVSYRVLLLDLIALALPPEQPGSLPSVLRSLADEELLAIALPAPGAASLQAVLRPAGGPQHANGRPSTPAETRMLQLERLLTLGLRPDFVAAGDGPGGGQSALAPDAVLLRWLRTVRDGELRAALARHAGRRAVLERVSWQFGPALFERALTALAGPQTAAVLALRGALGARLQTLRLEQRHLDLYLLAWLAARVPEPVHLPALLADVVLALSARLGSTVQALAPEALLRAVLPGQLAWPAALPAGTAGVPHLLAQLRAAREQPAALARLLAAVPRAQLMRLMQQLAPAVSGLLATLLLAAAALAGSAALNAAQRRQAVTVHLQQVAMLLVGDGWQAWSTQRMLSAIGRASARELGLDYPHYLALMHQASAARAQRQARFVPLLQMLEQEAARAEQASPAPWASSKAEAGARAAAPPSSHPLLFPPLPVGESFDVANAGAVLLWPYLDHFYRALDLLDGRDFRNEACRSRAVRLLQFLVDGDEDPPEHAMLLNKILCGMEECAPLEWGPPPTEAERELAQQLLYSVTQTWSKLKNTQTETLQDTFLQRGGALRRQEDNWSLQVEPGPYDMLLQSLPWNLSTIRLSWMRALLWVKWI